MLLQSNKMFSIFLQKVNFLLNVACIRTFPVSATLTIPPLCSLCINNTAANSNIHIAGFYNAPRGLLLYFHGHLIGVLHSYTMVCCHYRTSCKEPEQNNENSPLKTLKLMVENSLSHTGSEVTALLVFISPPKHLIRKWIF